MDRPHKVTVTLEFVSEREAKAAIRKIAETIIGMDALWKFQRTVSAKAKEAYEPVPLADLAYDADEPMPALRALG